MTVSECSTGLFHMNVQQGGGLINKITQVTFKYILFSLYKFVSYGISATLISRTKHVWYILRHKNTKVNSTTKKKAIITISFIVLKKFLFSMSAGGK